MLGLQPLLHLSLVSLSNLSLVSSLSLVSLLSLSSLLLVSSKGITTVSHFRLVFIELGLFIKKSSVEEVKALTFI